MFFTKLSVNFNILGTIFIIPRDFRILEHIFFLHIQEAFDNTNGEEYGKKWHTNNPENTHFLALDLNNQNLHYFGIFSLEANFG